MIRTEGLHQHPPRLLAPPGPAWSGTLYRTARGVEDSGSEREIELVAIPYYAWANREPGRMLVWLRRSPT
uniref:Non-reducing end beta-L-arabinofuranosidase-like GH127 C-terminal domain-containing protein n=1 Tax=Thermorudis peleae TaxID=1382356 RepID=A0A831T9Q5_9BACT